MRRGFPDFLQSISYTNIGTITHSCFAETVLYMILRKYNFLLWKTMVV